MWKVAAALALALVGALAWAGAARAEDHVLLGPPAAWVKPAPPPKALPAMDDAALRFLLLDQQVHFGPAGTTVYSETLARVQTPQGLSAMSTLTLPWDPALGGLTVHKVHIIRGGQVIDVLAKQSFTVLRRENNLEMAELDGVLTAVLQPEDLRVGDVIDLAYSETTKDPALAGHVQWLTPVPNLPIDDLRLSAASEQKAVFWRANEGFDGLKPGVTAEGRALDLAMKNVQPVLTPSGAPRRYQIGRLLAFSDFRSWAEVSAAMAPLYAKAAAIPADSPLQAEIARIRAASSDPKARAEAALALVEDQVRYVALAMNDGGLVPADAPLTWTRRFGDCKGKTVLLIGLLKALGVEAQPALVSVANGDGLDERLPMVAAFDHVMVRATIAGKVYWLDGTRLGDRRLDDIRIPPFYWALPVQASGAALVRLTPAALQRPDTVKVLKLDASAGLDVPAKAHAEAVLRGDQALAIDAAIANLAPAQKDAALRTFWTQTYADLSVAATAAHFDRDTGEERISADGTMKMAWDDGTVCCRLYEADGGRMGWNADFSRTQGPHADAPYAVAFPAYDEEQETIVLPHRGAGFTVQGGDLDQRVGPWAFHRSLKIDKGVFALDASLRSLAPELPAAEAQADAGVLKDMAKVAVYVVSPKAYVMTRQELDQYQKKALTSALDYARRGAMMSMRGRLAQAKADLQQAVALDPKLMPAAATLASVLALGGDAAGARAVLEKALAQKPDDVEGLRAEAFVSLAEGDFEGAARWAGKILDKDPKDRPARLQRATAYLTLGETAKALAEVDVLVAADAKDQAARSLRVSILLDRRQGAQALAEADAAIAADPQGAAPHRLKARVLESLGRGQEAQAEYDRAQALDHGAGAFLVRAAERPIADHAARLKDIEAALKLEPDNIQALRNRVREEAELGDYGKALADIDAVIAADGEEEAYDRIQRAFVYVRQGKTALAVADFDWARAHVEDTADAWNDVCYSAATLNLALDQALADCDRAVALAPLSTAILDSRAFVLLRLGRLKESIAQYDAALKLAPRLADSLYGRGVAELGNGQAKEGQADLDAARALQPRIDAAFKDYGVTPPAGPQLSSNSATR